MRARLEQALKEAMLERNARATSTLRLIRAAIKDRDIAERGKGNGGLNDQQILALLQAMIKQRQESIQLYEQGGRRDLAEQEAEEITIIQQFLPQQLTDTEMAAQVDAVIGELEAKNLKDMGRVMAELKQRFAGQMDPAKACIIVKQRLG
jgi:uncharacterized protein YqeY